MPTQSIRNLDYLVLYLLIATSGSLRFNALPDKMLIVFLGLIVVYAIMIKKVRINIPFLGYVAIVYLFLMIGYYYTDRSMPFNSIIGFLVKLFIAYFALLSIGRNFVDVYIRLFFFLAVVSLVGYIIDLTGLFRGVIQLLPAIGSSGGGYEGFFNVFASNHHYERNQGIFYEPGAYQIYINAAIIMLLFCPNSLDQRKRNIYFVVFTLVIITTISTTAILIYAGVVALVLLKSSKLSGKMKSVIVLSVIIGSGVASTFIYEVVINKLQGYVAGGQIERSGLGGSGQRRSFDAKVDIEIFKSDILGVGQKRYAEMFSTIGRTTATSSSNGITRTFAIFGFPFTLFLFASYYVGIRKLLPDMFLATFVFLLFILCINSQSFFVIAPATLAIIASIFVAKENPRFVIGHTGKYPNLDEHGK